MDSRENEEDQAEEEEQKNWFLPETEAKSKLEFKCIDQWHAQTETRWVAAWIAAKRCFFFG